MVYSIRSSSSASHIHCAQLVLEYTAGEFASFADAAGTVQEWIGKEGAVNSGDLSIVKFDKAPEPGFILEMSSPARHGDGHTPLRETFGPFETFLEVAKVISSKCPGREEVIAANPRVSRHTPRA